MANVIKANGIIEEYQTEKVRNSIRRAGIPDKIQNDVLEHINSKVYEKIPTKEIYGHVIEFLGTTDYPYAKTKYSLKQAIMDLGPTGYPFEDFVSEILMSLGYSTQTRQILNGKCINHEVDIIASKGNEKILIEAKFHNSVGTRTEVHVPMYTKSRFDDVKEKYQLTQAWIMTNTKATTDAIAFAECVGMKIISWSYPDNDSLRELIEKAGLHPITVLTTLEQGIKVKLLDRHIVRCKELHEKPEILNDYQLSQNQIKSVMDELNYICAGEHKI